MLFIIGSEQAASTVASEAHFRDAAFNVRTSGRADCVEVQIFTVAGARVHCS
jgi:hypothetical protein